MFELVRFHVYTTYLAVIFGGHKLHRAETELWPLHGVRATTIVVQVAEVLLRNWGGGEGGRREGGREGGRREGGGEEG